MAERFEDILNGCIDRLLQGDSLEDCLRGYPEQAAELEPLLRVALATQQASSIEPRAEFKAQARYQIQSLLHARGQKRQRQGVPLFGWLPRWATAVAFALFLVLVAGGGTVAAASSSLPGEILYPVKLATEQVRLAFAFSDTGKAELYAQFAVRRSEEIAKIAGKDEPQRIEELASRFEDSLKKVEELAAGIRQGEPGDGAHIAALRQTLYRNVARDLDTLGRAQSSAPDSSRPAVALARDRLMQSYRAALDALGNGHK